MAVRFTVYCWYDKESRIQQSNFRRWSRKLQHDHEAFEVIVFHDNPDIKKAIDKFSNLRFWRLHKSMQESPASLINEAIRYSRSEILVFVSPEVLVRKSDLYRLANFVRSDYAMSWLDLRYGFFHEYRNTFASILNRIRWIFRVGRFELYAHQNKPYGFYRASFFALNKSKLDKLFMELTIKQKEKLFRNDNIGVSKLNYYLLHLINKPGLKKLNAGKSSSYDFIFEKPGYFHAYKNTCALIRQLLTRDPFHYPFNIYRVILPVMQLTQVAFFVLVWFYPWKSLNLLAFYFILASSLSISIIKKKQWSPLVLLLWFFSWLVA